MTRSTPLGSRRHELSLLVFSALLLLVMLSTFQIYVLRDTVLRLYDEKVAEASAQAREVASAFVSRPWPSPSELRRLYPTADSVTIFDASKRTVASTGGEFDYTKEAGWITGEASFVRRGELHRVEYRIDSPVLLARERSLGILTWLVIGVDLGVLLLMVAFVRRWLRPLDQLIERARVLGAPSSSGEVAFLMRTFERAMEEMSEPRDDGLRALEGSLVRSMQSGVLMMDAQGTVLALNEIGAEILHVEPPAPEQSAPLADVLETHPDLRDLLLSVIGGRTTVFRRECPIDTVLGRRALGLTAHPLRRDEGQIQGWLVMFADLTDVKMWLADERLSENLRQLGELTAGVAHEMRNGLATLKGYLALIERSDGAVVDDYVQEIRLETEHLHRVVEDFLDFAQPGSVRLDDVDLAALLSRVAADPAHAEHGTSELVLPAPSRGASADAEKSEERDAEKRDLEDWTVQGDPALLTRAFGNLVMNAHQAQQRSGSEHPVRIVLEPVREPGPGLRIRIEDRGPGIPEAMRDRLFEAFASGRSDGVGLGLAIARRIVLLHGGEIQLSEREGGGTVAEVMLPAGKNATKGNENP